MENKEQFAVSVVMTMSSDEGTSIRLSSDIYLADSQAHAVGQAVIECMQAYPGFSVFRYTAIQIGQE